MKCTSIYIIDSLIIGFKNPCRDPQPRYEISGLLYNENGAPLIPSLSAKNLIVIV